MLATAITKLAEKLGIEGMSSHSFRRSAPTAAHQAGLNLREVAENQRPSLPGGPGALPGSGRRPREDGGGPEPAGDVMRASFSWLALPPSGDHPRRAEGTHAFVIASIRRHQPSFSFSAALMRSASLYRSLTDSRKMIVGSVSSNSSTFLAGPLKNNRKKYFLLLPSSTIPQ